MSWDPLRESLETRSSKPPLNCLRLFFAALHVSHDWLMVTLEVA